MINVKDIEGLISYNAGWISLKHSKFETAAFLHQLIGEERISAGNDYILSERGLNSCDRPKGVF